jgi:cytoskeletal protein RodZ
VVDDEPGEPAPIPWYEESWAVVTAGAAGVLAVGVLIYAVVQTSENSVEPSYGPQYYTDYSASTTSATSTTTTTSRTTRSSTTTTESTTETTESTTETEFTTETEPTTESTTSLDEENPFILNPFATTTTESG